MTKTPRLMAADAAARALVLALGNEGKDYTIADAAARSGLPLRDAELGLHVLVDEYRGHLRVGREGDLVFRFPTGFRKPWLVPSFLGRMGTTLGRTLQGALRFVVRAWIAALFVALLIALTFARSSGSDSRGGRGLGAGAYLLLRVIADALFWTFHPFSPVALGRGRARGDEDRDQEPFYAKVNRFFFGPDAPRPDPRAIEKRLVQEIRAQRGRIGLGDVLRVTGLPREQADPLLSRLLLDYDGSVEVSDGGGIVYRFEALRKTADETAPPERQRPVWTAPGRLPPFTGNRLGSNILVALLNGFNLVMSIFALGAHLTVHRVGLLIQGIPAVKLPPEGTAIALGMVPLIFSIALFALPLGRAQTQVADRG